VYYVTTETKPGRHFVSTLGTVLLFVKVDQESCSSVTRQQEAKTNKGTNYRQVSTNAREVLTAVTGWLLTQRRGNEQVKVGEKGGATHSPTSFFYVQILTNAASVV
jgi:hypothetical protein